MKIVIAGTRNIFPNCRARCHILLGLIWLSKNNNLNLSDHHTIISGGGGSVDEAAGFTAKDLTWGFELFPAQWDKHGKKAGPIRNAEMAEAGDVLIAVWDGESRGTKNMIDQMEKRGKRTQVFYVSVRSDD